MTAGTVADSPAPSSTSTSTTPRHSRLLTQLRTYTQNHISGHTSPTTHHRSYRDSISRAVGFSAQRLADLASEPLTPVVSNTSTQESSVPSQTERSPPATALSDEQGRPGPALNTELESPSSNLPSASQPTSQNGDPSEHQSAEMARGAAVPTAARVTRSRASNTNASTASRISLTEESSHEASAGAQSSANATNTSPTNDNNKNDTSRCQPTIRLYSYQDPNHSSRPSLPFTAITRTLPRESSIIRVGRYSERDGVPVPNPAQPSESPVGFKSKVVSRKHCEFSYSNNQWHIKDVGSSSGTFLNHMRLSPPSMPSRLYAVRDGDIIQLGVDFKGGEEMIFRCVRIRLECNRAWQQRQNEFNKNTANLINSLGKGADSDYTGCRECSICLGSVLRPYQCLFMAACAHVWHYKCVRRLIHGPEYPMFQCPNCRAYTDLSAEVDDSNDIYDNDASLNAMDANPDTDGNNSAPEGGGAEGVGRDNATPSVPSAEDELAADTSNLRIDDHDSATPEPRGEENGVRNEGDDVTPRSTPTNDDAHAEASASNAPRSPNIDIPGNNRQEPLSAEVEASNRRNGQSPGGGDTFEDCPLTPRNDLGPLALDSRAGRI